MSLDLIVQPFAFQGDSDTPPPTSPVGFVNVQDGYTKDYEISLDSGNPQAKAVERRVQNYLFNQASNHAQQWQRHAIPDWYAGMSGSGINGYRKNAIVLREQSPGGDWWPYRSLVNNNTTDPLSSPASWEYVRSSAENMALVPMPSGAGNAAAELIAVATDFNALITSGTYEVRDEAVFASCSNTPTLDGTSVVGMLEVKAWSDSVPKARVIQIFTSSAGRKFVRYSFDGVWIAWSGYTTTTETRNDKYRWCTATTADNLTYSLAATPAMTARVEGVRLRFKAPSSSTGTVLINDGIGSKPLYGLGMLAIGAGGLTNANIFMIEWNSTAIAGGCWVIVSAVSAPNQVPTGSYAATSPAQFDVTTKLATMEALQRALGNYQDAVQLGVGATTNLTAADVGKYLQAQGGTINLPLASAVKAGSAFTITASGSTVVSRAGADLLFNGGVSSTTITMADGDFMVVIALAAGKWEVFGTLGATAAQFDNSRRYASTAFVQRALGNLAGRMNAATTSTLSPSAAGNAIYLGIAAAHTVTLPLSTAVPAGSMIWFEGGSSANTINVQGADLIVTGLGNLTSITIAAGETVAVESNNLGQWTVIAGSGQLPYSSLFAANLGIPGWQKNPSGRIEVHGTFQASATPGAAVAVTFPLGATNGRNLTLTPANGGTSIVAAWFDSLSGTGFNGRCNVASAIVHYRAILD